MPQYMRNIWPGVLSCGENASLSINQVCLNITSLASTSLPLLARSLECYKCDFKNYGLINSNTSTLFVIDSSYAQELKVGANCSLTEWFDDFGIYEWEVGIGDNGSCGQITIQEQPERFWINIAVVAAIFIILFLLYRLSFCVLNSTWFKRLIYGNVPTQELDQLLGDPGSRSRNLARTKRLSRVASIDAFRGLSVLLMIFVNYGGGRYSVFEHTPWNGLTIADVVFPFFIWVMGLSAVLSLRSQLRATTSKRDIFYKILRRSMILVASGIILNSGKGGNDTPLRIPGVLQRIGLTYFVVASIELFFGRPQRNEQYGPWHICSEMTESIVQWVIVAVVATVHVVVSFLLPVPGCPTGYLGPGGWEDHSSYFNCTGGAAGYLDRIIFTPAHLYKRPTSAKIYHSIQPFDPEGLLGLLTSILMAFLGGHCGRIILSYGHTSSRVKRWLVWAIITGMGAGFLCGWSKNEGWIPINKNLWSLSYVLGTSSLAFFVFTLLYWLTDHHKFFFPLVYAGMNPLVVYLGHSILNKQLPWRWAPLTSTHFELVFMDITATLLWNIIAYVLYKNNIFIAL